MLRYENMLNIISSSFLYLCWSPSAELRLFISSFFDKSLSNSPQPTWTSFPCLPKMLRCWLQTHQQEVLTVYCLVKGVWEESVWEWVGVTGEGLGGLWSSTQINPFLLFHHTNPISPCPFFHTQWWRMLFQACVHPSVCVCVYVCVRVCGSTAFKLNQG